ncbi:MAG: ATP-binding cassette domain-containing protein [Sinomonas sp.]|nr:ATP-binding cassette domain-containing protein [Sinomonas sp.]
MNGTTLTADVRRFAYDDGGPAAVRGVRLALRAGSLTAVLGASGSGKSTLAKILAGWALAGGHARFEGVLDLGPGPEAPGGRFEFTGGPDDPRLRLGAWGARVAYVPQRPADLLTGASASVGEELAFSLEQRGVPRPEMLARVRAAAGAVGLGGLLDRNPGRLSGGEHRRLALGCALVGRPEVVMLDEPAASLDAEGGMALKRLVGELRSEGSAVVVFTAAVDALVLEAETCLLLEDGGTAAQGTLHDVLGSAALGASGVVVEEEPAAGGARVSGGPAPGRGTVPLAQLDSVTFSYGLRGTRGVPAPARAVLDGASLEAFGGEILALTGPNGAGKSTALRHLAGLAQPQSGAVRVLGRDIAGEPAGRVAQTVGTLFQDPRDQLFERTALREVAFGLGAAGLGAAGLERDAARERAIEALDSVGLEGKAGLHPYELSVSEQRLLALATVLARRPEVLLLDEPTVGLDRFGLRRLEVVVGAAAEAGAAVVLSTHAHPWVRRTAHRVLALSAGRFTEA